MENNSFEKLLRLAVKPSVYLTVVAFGVLLGGLSIFYPQRTQIPFQPIIEGRVTKLEGKLEANEEENKKIGGQISELQAHIKNQDLRIEDLESCSEEMRVEIRELRSRLARGKDKISIAASPPNEQSKCR